MNPKTIAVVEDDAWLAGSYRRLLEKEGYAVHVASHARQAIDTIDIVRPDLILLDVLLTETTALALLHELQSHADLAKIPVVLLTNLADTIALDDVSSYGVKAVLDKATILPDQLLAALRKALL